VYVIVFAPQVAVHNDIFKITEWPIILSVIIIRARNAVGSSSMYCLRGEKMQNVSLNLIKSVLYM
jgi:hypothetical protein